MRIPEIGEQIYVCVGRSTYYSGYVERLEPSPHRGHRVVQLDTAEKFDTRAAAEMGREDWIRVQRVSALRGKIYELQKERANLSAPRVAPAEAGNTAAAILSSGAPSYVLAKCEGEPAYLVKWSPLCPGRKGTVFGMYLQATIIEDWQPCSGPCTQVGMRVDVSAQCTDVAYLPVFAAAAPAFAAAVAAAQAYLDQANIVHVNEGELAERLEQIDSEIASLEAEVSRA